ncbi:CidA/LrgA family protein [Paenibacillus pinihumi]|uniref:CidA/LrgA family protein n=1 Tax=Paenibacillus pinihumi TaxID=669462 RepID=UPI000410D28B|nr:CidA/LrgA family protein [Paenibacillus pinihumi]
MKGLSILLGFTLLGYLIRSVLDIPVAGNVIGLILLVISLFAGWVKLEWVEDTAQFLLRHMMIFFAPIIVGTMLFFGRIGSEWLPIAASLIGATVIVLLVSGYVTARLAGKQEEKAHE